MRKTALACFAVSLYISILPLSALAMPLEHLSSISANVLYFFRWVWRFSMTPLHLRSFYLYVSSISSNFFYALMRSYLILRFLALYFSRSAV